MPDISNEILMDYIALLKEKLAATEKERDSYRKKSSETYTDQDRVEDAAKLTEIEKREEAVGVSTFFEWYEDDDMERRLLRRAEELLRLLSEKEKTIATLYRTITELRADKMQLEQRLLAYEKDQAKTKTVPF